MKHMMICYCTEKKEQCEDITRYIRILPSIQMVNKYMTFPDKIDTSYESHKKVDKKFWKALVLKNGIQIFEYKSSRKITSFAFSEDEVYFLHGNKDRFYEISYNGLIIKVDNKKIRVNSLAAYLDRVVIGGEDSLYLYEDGDLKRFGYDFKFEGQCMYDKDFPDTRIELFGNAQGIHDCKNIDFSCIEPGTKCRSV